MDYREDVHALILSQRQALYPLGTSEEAALAGYHDLFFMFAALTLFSLLPVLLMRGSKPVLPVKVLKRESG